MDIEKRRADNRRHTKTYTEKHREEVKARQALWYQLNKEKRRRTQKAYRQAKHAETAADVIRSIAKFS